MQFTIDSDMKIISAASDEKLIIAQGDSNSETVTFKMARYIDEQDMSLCDTIQICYLNLATGDKSQRNSGLYQITDMKVDEIDENFITFSWPISQNVTKYVGSLSFLVRFAKDTESWNTRAFSSIAVVKTIDNTDPVVEQYADVLEQWYTDLVMAGTTGINAINEAKTEGITAINEAKTNAAATLKQEVLDSIGADDFADKINFNINIANGTGTGSLIGNVLTENVASGDGSVAFGSKTKALALYSYAEGYMTTASGNYSHAEGCIAKASGNYSHAEGGNATASANYSHAEGSATTASGISSHAEGSMAIASGSYSHAGNCGTIASGEAQTAIGRYNQEVPGALVIIGNGAGTSVRRNIVEVGTDSVKINGTVELEAGINDGDVVNLKQLTDGWVKKIPNTDKAHNYLYLENWQGTNTIQIRYDAADYSIPERTTGGVLKVGNAIDSKDAVNLAQMKTYAVPLPENQTSTAGQILEMSSVTDGTPVMAWTDKPSSLYTWNVPILNSDGGTVGFVTFVSTDGVGVQRTDSILDDGLDSWEYAYESKVAIGMFYNNSETTMYFLYGPSHSSMIRELELYSTYPFQVGPGGFTSFSYNAVGTATIKKL